MGLATYTVLAVLGCNLLAQYRKKRKFEKTPEPGTLPVRQAGGRYLAEPKSEVAKKGKRPIFVIQEHWATHHHFDFRLELDGVLKSWAVPKGVPEKEGIKRLAISVEDHPLEYANFEGTIPEGQYGAGKVKIWDEGTYELSEQTKDRLEFVLHGKKLKGVYVMIKMQGRPNQWLILKSA